MSTISAVMIVRNEEAMLGMCLKSIQGLDEIVILDTGSTDKTAEVATAHGAKIYLDEYKWREDFAEARNTAQEKATGDWIFVIDADEELEPGGVKRLRKAVAAAGDAKAIGVWVKGKGRISLHHQPRLYRNDPDIHWVGMVHNYLTRLPDTQSDVTVLAGNSPNHAKDPDRSLRILEKATAAHPESGRYWYYLGREYGYKKRWHDSEVALQQCLHTSKWVTERADAYFLLARALWFQRKGSEARVACMQAIGLNPDFKEAILFLGDMSYEREKKIWHRYAALAESTGVLFRRVA